MKTTAFHPCHVTAAARLIDFGGWEMPVQYEGTLAEHKRVRSSVGLFDVSHMGEIRVRGPKALDALQHLVSNDVSTVGIGQSQYACLMNPKGGIVDDLFLYRLDDQDWLVGKKLERGTGVSFALVDNAPKAPWIDVPNAMTHRGPPREPREGEEPADPEAPPEPSVPPLSPA